MTLEEQYKALLSRHLPVEAVDYVYGFLDRHKVHFHISRQRLSKLGDYRRPTPQHPYHEMSVGGDLTKEMFLLVFLHEAAHLLTVQQHKAAQPHGHEWQQQYARLIQECLALFPEEVRPLLAQYASRIPLQRALQTEIERRLQGREGVMVLNDLQPGTRFRLTSRPTKLMLAVEKRRTRWRCHCLTDGQYYLVSGEAPIQVMEGNAEV